MSTRTSDGHLARVVNWRLPTMPERLNAHQALSAVRTDRNIVSRVVSSFSHFNELMSGEWSSRYFAEACLWGLQHRLHVERGYRLSAYALHSFRRAGRGLDVNGSLFAVWRQCVARFHSRASTAPRSVRVILGGLQHQDPIVLREDIASVLDDDTPFHRRGNLHPTPLANLKVKVLQELVEASGVGDIALAQRFIAEERNFQLGRERTVKFEKLDPSALAQARALAVSAGRGGDTRFVFYLFRCFQRVAAYQVDGVVMWRAAWLRGAKGNVDAIPGASSFQTELAEVLRTFVFEVEQGHSGRNATATKYRLRFTIPVGPVDEAEAARELGLELTPRGLPRR